MQPKRVDLLKPLFVLCIALAIFQAVLSYNNIIDAIKVQSEAKSNSILVSEVSWDYGLLSLPVEKVLTKLEIKKVEAKEIETVEMPKYDIKLKLEYQQFLWEKCNEYGQSYEEMLALMYQENRSFDINAVSADGHDKGLVQARDLYYNWHKELLGRDFSYFNPYDSMELGIKIVQYCESLWVNDVGNDKMLYYSLNSYNMGEGNFKKYLRKYGERPREYTTNILLYKNNLEQFGRFIE